MHERVPAAAGQMSRNVLRIADLYLELLSNNRRLIADPQYFKEKVPQCLLTDFHRVETVDDPPQIDGSVTLVDLPGHAPETLVRGDRLVAFADFSRREAELADKRYAFLGTQGVLYRFVIALLERKRRIHSLHSNALFNEDTGVLTLVVGGENAGKTPVLLSGIRIGLTVFGTELTHFCVGQQEYHFLKGGVVDNIRPGHLFVNFPDVAQRLNLQRDSRVDLWEEKVAVDFAGLQSSRDRLSSPPVRILLPWVEAERKTPLVKEIEDKHALVKLLYVNASEKIASSFLVYYDYPLTGFDAPELALARFDAMTRFVETAEIVWARRVIAPPEALAAILA